MSSAQQQARRRDSVQYDRLPETHELSNMLAPSDGVLANNNNTVQRPPSKWTQDHTMEKQHLTTLEAASLIVNKMIGTGIFTTPGMVLALTQNKSLALSFWIVGGLYAAIW